LKRFSWLQIDVGLELLQLPERALSFASAGTQQSLDSVNYANKNQLRARFNFHPSLLVRFLSVCSIHDGFSMA
jgi:hypothetical protein